jgi:hypothetical protein
MDMVVEKPLLSLADIEAQTALELPDRETPAIVVIGCLAVCVGEIRINIEDINVAAQICAQVEAITVLGAQLLDCTIRRVG